nr:antA/AntB antirepressor family protein [uncultured Solibaculum sp.]
MNELIKVDYSTDRPTVSARELHEFLEVKTAYKDWFPRMCEYGFSEGTDFCSFLSESTGGRPAQDAQLTIDMAKEICMLQRNERGKQARQYFIQLEKDWNSPEKVMARALQIAEKQILSLRAINSALTVENQIMQPKADYFDELVDRNLNTGIRETAKELGVKEKAFVSSLIAMKYVYRDKKGKLQPYAQYADDLFVLKECYNEKTQWSGTQLLVTPKGRETFRLLCLHSA